MPGRSRLETIGPSVSVLYAEPIHPSDAVKLDAIRPLAGFDGDGFVRVGCKESAGSCVVLSEGGRMDLARAVPVPFDFEADLLLAYPLLARRLALVLRDADEAEDVAQAAFTRALEQRHRFQGGDARAWLYTIGLRLAFNELRRRRRLTAMPTGEEPNWAMTSQPDLWIALAQLDPSQRAALVLSVLDGYTHAEIARMLGVRPGTVSSWLSRSKERLRALLGDES